jgi:hypothetical protein
MEDSNKLSITIALNICFVNNDQTHIAFFDKNKGLCLISREFLLKSFDFSPEKMKT